jgi:hypothetical protein
MAVYVARVRTALQERVVRQDSRVCLRGVTMIQWYQEGQDVQ